MQEKQGNQAADQPLLSSESGHFPAYPTDFPPLLSLCQVSNTLLQ